MATTLKDLKVKLFTDGAYKAQIVEMAKNAWIAGFTTNPSLLKKAGVRDYEAFGRDLSHLCHVSAILVPDRKGERGKGRCGRRVVKLNQVLVASADSGVLGFDPDPFLIGQGRASHVSEYDI